GMLSSDIKIPGELQAFQQVDLYAKVNSYVKQLYVDVGSEVKQGQLLATLEAPEINSQVSASESRLRSFEAVYIASKANYNRLMETSKTPGTISPNDLDLAMAKQNSDLAQYEAAKAAYNEVVNNRDYLQVKAPFTGVISARNVSQGAYVGPSGKGSDLPMFTLQTQQELRLIVSVPEAYTSYLTSKSEVSFTVVSLPNQTFKAQVKRLAGALDQRLRSERIEMDVTNNNKKLLPGMVAEIVIPLPARDSALLVPANAVVSSTEKVYVVKIVNGKATWVTVQKGRSTNKEAEVFGNLHVGDTVAAPATEELRDGTPVGKTTIGQGNE
ncbi:MAG: efflux RND transporter periplasmic adaptor subunit, partial [Bacteroidota bacterium]|nr:efflux RND transporter periplasmic adaptor subunit [Bacteroidota bacterium]